jgi:magnesium-transporting ATPase (P-type)
MIKSPVTERPDDAASAVGGEKELKIEERPIEELIAELESDAEKGISKAEAKTRGRPKEEGGYGPNELEKPPRISLFMLFIVQLNSVIMYLLMAAVVASAVIKATGDKKDEFLSYVDSIAILIIVLINATIAAVTENNANDALEALSNLQSPKCTVVRDGEELEVESKELVPGDIVKMGTGDVVPADVRLIKVSVPGAPALEMIAFTPPLPIHRFSRTREDDLCGEK